MSRPRNRSVPRAETLEGKSAPSSLVPVLTHHTFNQVVHQIDQAAGTYAKTQNPVQFDASLARISYRIPYGHAKLYPAWQADEGIYDGTRDGSGLAMVRQIKVDLAGYVRYGVSTGLFAFR